MRKLGVNIEAENWGLTEDEALGILRAAGFDCFFTDYYYDESKVDRYAEAAAKNGIRWESMHAPFTEPVNINAIWREGVDGDAMLGGLLATVRACARHGVRVAVIHLSSGEKAPCVNDIGRRRLDMLVNEAVKTGVTLGFENLRKLANLAFVFELYADVPQVGFCWDVGHEACFTRGLQFMPLFGDRLTYTHIHDNLCQYNGDLHMIPFDGAIDFNRVTAQLRESGYQGTLTLELLPDNSDRYVGVPAPEYYARAYAVACRLRDMVDGPAGARA